MLSPINFTWVTRVRTTCRPYVCLLYCNSSHSSQFASDPNPNPNPTTATRNVRVRVKPRVVDRAPKTTKILINVLVGIM